MISLLDGQRVEPEIKATTLITSVSKSTELVMHIEGAVSIMHDISGQRL